MRIDDYVGEINNQHQDIFQLKNRVDYLEQENIRLNTLLNDKLVDFEMDIAMLKKRMQIKDRTNES